MLTRLLFFCATVFLALPINQVQAQPKQQSKNINVVGVWLTEAKSSHVELFDCGDGTPCGKITWLNPDVAGDGVDLYNPDPNLRSRKLVGLQIMQGYRLRRQGNWTGGRVYDAETGKTYGSRLRLLNNNTLQIKGCLGPICETQIWTRVAANQ